MSVRRVVLGIDGSEGSVRAVRWAAGLAAPLGAEVIAVHVFEPLAHLGASGDMQATEAEVARQLEEEWVRPLVDAGVEVDCRVLHGPPAEVLLDVAGRHDGDLIVVGARGLGRIRGIALGSVSSKLIQSAPCPVVVIPPADRG